MKKSITLIAVLFFTCFFSFSQKGQIIYSIKVDENSYNDVAEQYKERLSKMKDYANHQNFELNFIDNKSSFKIVERLVQEEGFDKQENEIAQSAMTTRAEIYFDHENKLEIQKEFDGQLIQINYEKPNWEITTETKNIDNYLCYKATCQESYIPRDGKTKTREIVVWFAPSLPYSYGPKGFFGLPGLILELKYIKTTYFATKIDLEKKDIVVTFPKGKTTTQEEYTKKLKALMGM